MSDLDQRHHLHPLHLQVHAAMQEVHDHLEHRPRSLESESGHVALMESLHAVHHHLKEAHDELSKYSEDHEHEHHEAH